MLCLEGAGKVLNLQLCSLQALLSLPFSVPLTCSESQL